MRTFNELTVSVLTEVINRVEQRILDALIAGDWECHYDAKDEAVAEFVFSELKLAGYNCYKYYEMSVHMHRVKINF